MNIRRINYRMTETARLFLAAVFMLSVLTPPASAEGPRESIVDRADLERAMAEQLQREDSHREAILRLLERPEVQEMVEGMGVDLQRAKTAVATLEGDELAWLGEMAVEAESDAAGGISWPTGSYMPILYVVVLVIIILVLVL